VVRVQVREQHRIEAIEHVRRDRGRRAHERADTVAQQRIGHEASAVEFQQDRRVAEPGGRDQKATIPFTTVWVLLLVSKPVPFSPRRFPTARASGSARPGASSVLGDAVPASHPYGARTYVIRTPTQR
jgi:hypothetical protein